MHKNGKVCKNVLVVGTDSVLISKQKRRKIEHINKHYPFDI